MEKQLNSTEKLTKVSKKIARVERNEKGQLKKGSILNPEGLKEGTRQFHTLMDEAVKEIAVANKLTEGEVWQVLIKRGYSEAKDGNYPFFKDLLDRYYGKAVERHELTGKDGEGITIQISEDIARKNDIDQRTKNDSN